MLIKTSNKAIFAFSDTHGNHRHLQVPENADIVICAVPVMPWRMI